MSSPTADQVAANTTANIPNPNAPNTDIFAGAWYALIDFTAGWAQNTALDIQTYGDVIGSYFPVGGS